MLERRRRESERRRGGGGDGERRHGSEGARVWTGGGGGAVRGSGDAQSRWRKRTVGIGGLKWKTRGRGRAGEADAREAGNHASSYFFLLSFFLGVEIRTYQPSMHGYVGRVAYAWLVCMAGRPEPRCHSASLLVLAPLLSHATSVALGRQAKRRQRRRHPKCRYARSCLPPPMATTATATPRAFKTPTVSGRRRTTTTTPTTPTVTATPPATMTMTEPRPLRPRRR